MSSKLYIKSITNFSSPLGAGGKSLAIKICGMKHPSNILEVAALQPDMMGFIFYPKSPRYAEALDETTLNSLSRKIMKIGVFVNETLDVILETVKRYNLQGVQLHGTESTELCYTLRSTGLIVIKAFPIADASDLDKTDDYEGTCDFYLFDTKTPAYGGSGQKFNWATLDTYQGETRYLLSGGIGADDIAAIKEIKHQKIHGIDLNSRFETEPGMKNAVLLNDFIQTIYMQHEQNQ